jgi:hypothetical protein
MCFLYQNCTDLFATLYTVLRKYYEDGSVADLASCAAVLYTILLPLYFNNKNETEMIYLLPLCSSKSKVSLCLKKKEKKKAETRISTID